MIWVMWTKGSFYQFINTLYPVCKHIYPVYKHGYPVSKHIYPVCKHTNVATERVVSGLSSSGIFLVVMGSYWLIYWILHGEYVDKF